MESIMYVIIGIIALALIFKIAEDVQKGIAEGNEKKRQKDLMKEVNDSNHPNNKVCCRFCVHWLKDTDNNRKCFNSFSNYKLQKTDADFSCNLFASHDDWINNSGSNPETTGNNSGSTGEA